MQMRKPLSIPPVPQSLGLSPDYRHAKKRFLWNPSALRRLPPKDSRNMDGDEEVEQTDLSDLVEVDQRPGIRDRVSGAVLPSLFGAESAVCRW
mgnify:CR=1 FL=1